MSERSPDISNAFEQAKNEQKPGATEVEISHEKSAGETEMQRAKLVAGLGEKLAADIGSKLNAGNLDTMNEAVDEFVADAVAAGVGPEKALTVLQAQLSQYESAYKGAGHDDKAFDISSFKMSLPDGRIPQTGAGKDFMAKLEGGTFADMPAAVDALRQLKAGTDGNVDEESVKEYRLLYDKASKRFADAAEPESLRKTGTE